jgi:hypothetical protein
MGENFLPPGDGPASRTQLVLEFVMRGSSGTRVNFTLSHSILWMPQNGNLVSTTADNTVVWSSNTDGNPGAFLRLQNNGNAVIFNTSWQPLWSTNTQSKHAGIACLREAAMLPALFCCLLGVINACGTSGIIGTLILPAGSIHSHEAPWFLEVPWSFIRRQQASVPLHFGSPGYCT